MKSYLDIMDGITDQPRVEVKSNPLLISAERLELTRCPVVFGGASCPCLVSKAGMDGGAVE
jgi:hypothetical protein